MLSLKTPQFLIAIVPTAPSCYDLYYYFFSRNPVCRHTVWPVWFVKSYFLSLYWFLPAVFIDEHDVATYTIKAVDDPRALNKILYIKPPKNIYSFNELVSLWEKKIGKTLERIYVLEDQILKRLEESPGFPLAVGHLMFVKGDLTNFKIEPSFGVEASELYPDVLYTTVEEYLNQFV